MRPLGAGGNFARLWAEFRAGYQWRDPGVNVWVTEVGVSRLGREAVSIDEQAAGLDRLLRRLLTMPDVRGVFIHTLYAPSYRGVPQGERGYGVLSDIGRPYPAFCRIRDVLQVNRRYEACE